MKIMTKLPIMALALALPLLSGCTDTGNNAPTAAVGENVAKRGTWVTDDAHILTKVQRDGLARKLSQLEKQTGHQMVVMTVPGLSGRDVADVARDLGNAWGVGRAGQDDGVILLVAPNERKVRIAVGYGLEKRLTDIRCKQIIDQAILPRFRKGDLAGGIEQGVDTLIADLR